MSAVAWPPPSLQLDSPEAERTRKHWKKALEVEPEYGPGGYFKIAFLGSSSSRLSAEEYRRRQGAKFTTETLAVLLRNPDDATFSIQFEMAPLAVDTPAIAVLLLPCQQIWVPVVPGYVFRIVKGARVPTCGTR